MDALIQSTLEQYEQRSIFARADWDDPGFTKDQENMTPETAVQRFLGQIHYVLHDPQISRASKDADDRAVSKLTDGAAANQADLHGCHALLHRSDPFSHPQGKLTDHDPELMAAQLCLPISVWINLCDREPVREKEVMQWIERYIRQFFVLYQTEGEA